jgi:putative ABC transport system permease protein
MWLFVQDLRLAVRTLRRDPVFTAVALLSLALGIGANTALFQILDAVRLRSLPVEDPGGLAIVQLADRTGWRGSQASPYPALTNPLWEAFRDRQDAFEGVLAWASGDFELARADEPRRVRGLFVSGSFFRVLGMRPLLGRAFEAGDDRRGCGLPGAVISHAFWQGELGGDPAAVGRTIRLNERAVDVIGVAPAGFTGPEVGRSFDVAVPICSQAVLWSEGHWLDEGTVWWLTVEGRLRPGSTLEAANARLRSLSPEVFRSTLPPDYPAANAKDYLGFRLTAVPGGAGVSSARDQYSRPLLFLLATSGLVLLITCANLANLMLARAAAREREIAVRLAIGSSRLRVVRHVMAEGLILSAAGGSLGVFLAAFLGRSLVGLLSTEGSPFFLDLEPDRAVVSFALALTTLTCLLSGLVPAWRATSLPPADALRAPGRAATARREALRLRRVLVVSQVAFSLVLLVGALLFSRTLRNVLAVDVGFQPDGVLIAQLDLSRARLPPGGRAALKSDAIARIRAVEGVAAAAEVGVVPLSGGSVDNEVWIDGADPGRSLTSNFNWIGPGFLRTMSITLLAGRDFDEHDTKDAPRVAIVNRSLARRLGFGASAVGRRFRRQATPTEPEQVFEVVGLVNDTKYRSLREEFVPIAFLPFAQGPLPDFYAQVALRTSAPAAALSTRLRAALEGTSPTVRVDVRPLMTTVREGLLRERLMALLSGFFGVLGAVTAAVGLYGVTSYAIAQRTHEIGIRIALGADRRSVVTLVLGEVATLLVVGLAVGAALALAAGRAAESMLFGLRAHDAASFVLGGVLLTAVAGAAGYVPTRRASRLDPMAALREE